jgi:hypothetical protein
VSHEEERARGGAKNSPTKLLLKAVCKKLDTISTKLYDTRTELHAQNERLETEVTDLKRQLEESEGNQNKRKSSDAAAQKLAEDSTYFLVEGHITLKRGIRPLPRSSVCVPSCQDKVTLSFKLYFRSSSDAHKFLMYLTTFHHYGALKGQVTLPDICERCLCETEHISKSHHHHLLCCVVGCTYMNPSSILFGLELWLCLCVHVGTLI